MYDLLILYGAVSMTHLFIQLHFAHSHYIKKQVQKEGGRISPSVAIIIPSYNEQAGALSRCVESCLNQNYAGKIKVLLLDDGSRDAGAFESVGAQFSSNPMFEAIRFERNRGKREVQKEGFDRSDNSDVIVTIDSDTVLHADAIFRLVQPFCDPHIGAVTGDVHAIKTPRLLSRLIDVRYWTAFNQERSAQSLFSSVLCCSGPLSAYRTEIIRKVKWRYVNQAFLGRKCTYGDDRHLTNLVLEDGYGVVFEPYAKAKTGIPENFTGFLRQQARWNRSFYREMLWTFRLIWKRRFNVPPYMAYDLLMQAILPFFLIGTITFMLTRSWNESWIYFISYLSILVGIALIRASYAFLRTGDRNFFLFPLYAFIHIIFLVPLRIFALFTLNEKKWGTR